MERTGNSRISFPSRNTQISFSFPQVYCHMLYKRNLALHPDYTKPGRLISSSSQIFPLKYRIQRTLMPINYFNICVTLRNSTLEQIQEQALISE